MKPGQQLLSAVCATKVIVIRAPDPEVVIGCGGHPMRAPDDGAPALTADPALLGGTVLGKRYLDEKSGLEVLCVAPGDGSLTCSGVPMEIQDAKPLPSSD